MTRTAPVTPATAHEVDCTVYTVAAATTGLVDPPAAVLRLIGDYYCALYHDRGARVFKAAAVQPRPGATRGAAVVLLHETRTRVMGGVVVARMRAGTTQSTTGLSLARWIARWSIDDDVDGLVATATDQAGSLDALRWSTPAQIRSFDSSKLRRMRLHPCVRKCADRNAAAAREVAAGVSAA